MEEKKHTTTTNSRKVGCKLEKECVKIAENQHHRRNSYASDLIRRNFNKRCEFQTISPVILTHPHKIAEMQYSFRQWRFSSFIFIFIFIRILSVLFAFAKNYQIFFYSLLFVVHFF